MQNFPGARFQLVSPEVLILFLHFTEPRQNSIEVLGFVGMGHELLELDQFMMKIPEAAAAGDGFIKNRPAAHLVDFLTE